MQAFDFQDVTLNPGRWKDALDETMNFYLNIPNDNIMKYMRESVGRPAPGIYYTGWVSTVKRYCPDRTVAFCLQPYVCHYRKGSLS